LELIGFLFLCGLNTAFSAVVIFNLIFGGGDLGPLLTGWVNWEKKVFGVCILVLNIYFWYLLFINSPFVVMMRG